MRQKTESGKKSVIHWKNHKKEEEGKPIRYLDEDGLGLELTISGSTKTITDKEGNVLTFNAAGNLKSIADVYGNTATITYTTGTGASPQISKITDGAGHVISFTKAEGNNFLRKITDPAGKCCIF